MAVTTTNLGVITAYGDAVAAGYTGTKAEWQALMASYATVAEEANDAKDDAVAAKNTAVAKATEATTAASTATAKASEASASAQSITQSAAQIQENTDDIDQLKSEFTAFGSMETISKNILDDSKSERGYLSSGVVVPNTASTKWNTTPFIDVSGLTAVIYTALRAGYDVRNAYTMKLLCTYDASKDFIEAVADPSTTYTVEEGVKYIRFCYNYENYSDVMVESGTSSDLVYVPYEYASYLHNSPYMDSFDGSDVVKSSVKKVYGTNRLDLSETYDGYLTNTGELHANTASTHYTTSGLCYVKGCKQLLLSANDIGSAARFSLPFYFLCTYNENKEFIEMIDSTVSSPWIVNSNNVAYVRFSWRNDKGYEKWALEDKAVQSRVFRPFYEGYILTDYANYKWDAVGDSLTEYNQRANTNYCQYIAERLGITVKNYGASGTGYKRDEENSKAFYQRISSIDTTADIVTIFGSGNDMPLVATALGDIDDTGTSTICGCINTTIDNLYAIMPTVQLGIITPCPWKDYNPNDETNPMALYSAKLVEICKARGIPCLDLYHCSNMRPWDATFRGLAYKNDDGGGTHPDELGQKIIATQIEAFIKSLML